MDSLYGLIRYIFPRLRLFAFLLLPFVLAIMVVSEASAYEERWGPQQYTTQKHPTPEESCDYIRSYFTANYPINAPYSVADITDTNFRIKVCNIIDKNNSPSLVNIYRQYRCENGTGSWLPADPSNPPDCYEAPPEPEQCEDGRILDEGLFDGPAHPIGCVSGCRALRVTLSPPELNCRYSSQGVGQCSYNHHLRFIDTGVSCDEPNPDNPKVEKQPDCPQCRCMERGGSWGEVNGVGTCVPVGSAGSAPVTKPTAPPKVQTTTPPATEDNPNPEPVTEVTEAPTVTITPPASGSPVGTPSSVTETTTDENGNTISTTKSLTEFCSENPTSTICRDDEKSVFSGSCGSFYCEGDAIQCAIAKRQHQTICEMQEGDAISDFGEQLTQGLGDVDNPLDNPEQVSLDSLDTSSFMPKSGLQDISFSFSGSSITLPLSRLNTGLQFAGYIVLAFSFIAAARIVFM